MIISTSLTCRKNQKCLIEPYIAISSHQAKFAWSIDQVEVLVQADQVLVLEIV